MRDFQSYFKTAVVWIAAIGLVFGSAATAAAQFSNFKVTVSLTDREGNAATGLNVVFQNTSAPEGSQAAQEQDLSEDASTPGSYSVTLTDLDIGGIFKQVLIPKEGDVVSIRATQTVGGVTSPWSTLQRTITKAELDAGETNIAMTESGLTVEFEEADVRGDGVSTATLVVTVVDASGNLIDDADLTATTTAGSVGAFTSVGSGKHEAVFNAPLTSQDVTAEVTVTYGADSGKATINIIGVPANITVSVDPTELVADGASTAVVTATLTREGEAVVNETVTIEATLGTVGDVTNNEDGTYTATFTAGTTAGTAEITVTASAGDTGEASLTLTPGAPAGIVASVDPTQIRGDSITTATFTATIADANGNPVSGLENVTATLTGGGSIGDVADAGDGTYTAVYTSPLVKEDAVATVEFAYAALTPASATLTVTGEPDAEATILVVKGLATYLDRSHAAPNGLSVLVENVTKDSSVTSATGDDGLGRYSATFFDLANPNAVVASSNDLIRVTVTDPESNQSTVVERRLTADEVNATIVDIDVETNLKATASEFLVAGTVQYSDGTAAVLPGAGLRVEVSIGEAVQGQPLNEAPNGVFSIQFAGPTFEVATGDLINITVYDIDNNVVATGSQFTFIASSAQVIGGEIDLGDIQTTVDAHTASLKVIGSLKYNDGAAGILPREQLTAIVTVGADRKDPLSIDSPMGDFEVSFLDAQSAAKTGDLVSIEVLKNGDVVASMSRQITSQEVIDGAFNFNDVVTSLPAMSGGTGLLIVSGTVTADVEIPDGSMVLVTNLHRGDTSTSSPVTITNGKYSAVLQSSNVGAPNLGDVAETGDVLLIEVLDPDGVVLAANETVLDSMAVVLGAMTGANVQVTGVVIALTIGGDPVDANSSHQTQYDANGVASATVVATVSGSVSAGELTFDSGGVGSFEPLDGNTRTFSTVYADEMYFSSDRGLVTITVSAGDKASRTVTLNVVDIDDPVINSITPEGPMALIGEEETLTADVEDNTAVASIVWEFPDGTTQSGMAATKSFDEVARYSVTLTVTDVANNEVTRTKTIDVLDLRFSTASDQVEYDENGVATVAVTIEAEGPAGIIDFGDSVYTLTLTDGVSDDTDDFTKTYESDADLGDHTLTATVTNEDGQTVIQSVTVELVDLIAPTAELTSVAEPLELVGQPVDVSVTVVENTEIASIEWRADGEVLESRAPTAEEIESGVFAYTYMQEGDDPAPALVNVTFHVTDTSDNTNDADTPISVPITFVDVEFSAESLEVPYDADGVASTAMTIVVNGPDGVVTPESAGLTMALTPDDLFPDLETFSKTYASAEDLGEHEVTLTITSEAGEQIVKMLTLTLVDHIYPMVTLTSTAEPLKEAGQSVMVSVDVVENTEIRGIEWRVDGVAVEIRKPEAGETAFSYTYTQDDPAPAAVEVSFHTADTSRNRNDDSESADATPINVPITFVEVEFSAKVPDPDPSTEAHEVYYDADGVASLDMTIVMELPAGVTLTTALAPEDLFIDDTFSNTYEAPEDIRDQLVSLTIAKSGEEIVKELTLALRDMIPPTVSPIAADSTNSAGEPFILTNRDLTLSASASDNTEILTVEWVFPDGTVEGALDAEGNTSVTRVFTEPGDFTVTLRVVDAGGNESTSETMVTVRRVEVGGLALDLRGASEIIVALLQSPLVSDLLAENGLPTIPQLLGDNPTTADVLQLLNSPEIMAALQQAGLTLPGLPAMLNPVIIPDDEDLYLENFGNALSVPHLEVWDNLSGVADGSYRIEKGLTLTGHKLSLFAVAPKAMEVIVTLHGSDGMTYPVSGMSAEGTGTFQHEFAVDEELFLATLPAWPASDSSPIQEVTLRLSTNGMEGPYRSVPLTKEMRTVGGYAEPVWSATDTLDAGKTHYYYYVVEMTHQIPVGGGKRTAKMLVIPDPRNLQMEPTIDIASLTIEDLQNVANTGRVPLVSKFSTPSAEGLWTFDFDLSQIPDGDYQVTVTVDGEDGFVTPDGAAGMRPLSINRAPEPVSDVTVEAINGATHYIDESGAVVTTNANGEGSLSLTAEAMDGGEDIYDRTSVVFQIRPVTGEPTVDFWTTINIPTSVTPLMDGLANDEFVPLLAYVNQIAGGNGLLGRIGPEPVRTEMLDYPQVGSYQIRAISIDQFSNLSMSNPQAVEVVPRTVGEFNVSSLGIGNLKGNEAERYISAEVPEDGSVAADDFRIWSDTTQLELMIRSLRDVTIPLTSATIQSSTDGGATWTDLKMYDEAALADVDASWMSDMTSHMIDGVQLATDGVTEYRLRVAAENRLTISGVGPETVLVVDVLPIPVTPEVLAFASAQAEGTSVSPDSGGARDQLVLTVDTPFNMLPKAPSVVIEISADGGQTFMPLAMEMGGPEAGTISADDHTAADGMPEIGVNRTTWTAVWDTTMAADTVENMEPEARDASMDDNPYIVRASLMGEGGTAYLSETLTIPVDNVDDVPPLSSTVVTLVEREAKAPGTFEAVDANEDGSYTVRSDVRITASVTAGYLTIEGGDVALVVVDESGAVMEMLGDAAPVAEGQESYSFEFDSTMFPNGALRLAVLATDASGNQELTVMDTTVVANIANILIGGLLPDDPGVYELIRITQTGALMTDRTFATDQADRPIGGTALFELDTENAMTAQAYISANMADLMDEALADATPMEAVGENGAFQLPLDVSGLADGEYYVRIVLAASPNVFAPLAPVAFTVDNTAPPLTIEAPASGTAVNTRPTIVSEGYEDPTGIVTVGLTLSANGSEVFTGFAGGNADMRLAGNEDLVNADGMTTDGLMFAAPQISYITPSDVRHPSGSYVATGTATDYAGNVAVVSAVYVIEQDATAPTVSAYSPTGVIATRTPTVRVSFTEDNSGVTAEGVSIQVSDNEGNAVAGTTTLQTIPLHLGDDATADDILDALNSSDVMDELQQGDGPQLSGIVSFIADEDLANGAYSVVASVADAEGNAAPVSWEFTVYVDDNPPVITEFSPSGTIETADTTLSATFYDELEVTSVTFTVDGGEPMDADAIVDNTSATLAVTGLSDGAHTVVVTATDALGNVGSGQFTFTVSLDLEPPVITAFSPTGVVEMPDTTLAATFLDESEVVSVTFAVDGGEAMDADAIADNTSATLAVTGLADGDHTVVVTATDEHGNVGSAEYQFTVSLDLEAPVITTVSPTGVVEMPDTTLAVAFSDESAVTSVTFAVDGGDAMDAAIADDNTSATLAVTGLADGDHTVVVTATDEHGNVGSAEYQFTVSLDLEPPVITTVSPTGVVEMPDTTLAVAFSDESAVTSVTFAVDGGDAMDAAIADDNTSATLAVTGLADGDHTVVVTATDEHGNVGSAEYQFTVSLDLEAPVITTVSPTGVVEMPDTTLAAAFSDASAVTSATFAVDGGDAVDAAIADDNTSATLAVTGLSDGDHTVVVTVTDEHGNVGSAEYQFTVSLDLEAPVITTVSPTGVVEMPDTTLAATFSDASAVVSVTFAVDGGDAVDAAAIADNTSATLAVTGLADGDHTVVVTATDEHGNVGSAEYQFTVSLDLEAPVITTVSPTGTVESADTTLAATFSDASEVDSVTFSVDGGAAQDAASIADNTMARLPVTGLSDGEHTVVVTATDEHGNVGSAEYLFTVSLDTAAPVITSISPTGVVRTADTTLAVNFFDDSEVDSVTFAVDGGAAQDAADIIDNSRAHLPVDGLSQGSHTVVVTATDEHGNKASAQFSFLVEIDMIPPTIATTAPTGYVRSLRPLISATFTDNLAGVDADSVELMVNGNAVNADATDSSVSYQPSADLATGTHEVTLTLADALGNETSTSWTFTIETTPPSIWPAAPVDGARVGKNVAARTDVVVSAYYTDADSGIDVDSVELTVTRNGNRVAGTIESKTESGVAWKAQNVLRAGIYTVTVSVADNLGNATEHSWSFIVEEEEAITIPVRVVPNPFEKDVAVWVGLGKEAEVRVRIYDLNGRLVAERPGQILLPGRHAINLTEETCNYGRGVYICQVIVDAADRERVVKIVKMAKIR